jgi:hypothetical protein
METINLSASRLRTSVVAAFVLLVCFAAITPAQAQTMDQLAARGAVIANADPLAIEIRKRAPNDSSRHGFDIGMAAAEGQTLPGPGKQRIHDALPPAEQGGFDAAVSFSLQRNRNAQFAATGAAIARADPVVAQARNADNDVFYWLGFDIASGLFGNPALGAAGNTATGPGSLGIRNALNPAAQRGFNASVALHLSRNYRLSVQVAPIQTPNTQPNRHELRLDPATPVVAIPRDSPRDRECAEFFALRRPKSPSIAAAYEPPFGTVHVFAIDAHGTLKDVWRHDNPPGTGRYAGTSGHGFWEPSFSLSAPGLAPAGSPLAAVWQPLNEQLEVFTIAPNGALQDIWRAHNGAWHAPIYISPPNFAPPSAHIAAIFHPLNNTLEVFAVDSTGAVRVAWKAQNGTWQPLPMQPPRRLTPPGSAPPGAPLAVVWQPLNEQLEVFWIDKAGAAHEVLKRHNRSWEPPRIVAAAGFANPGAGITAIWQPLNEQLEVFSVDRCGAIKDVWKAHNSEDWFKPVVIYGAGNAPKEAALLASWDPQFEKLQVIAMDLKGNPMSAYKNHNRPWSPGARGLGYAYPDKVPAGPIPPGAPLAAAHTMNNELEIFMLDGNQAVRTLTRDGYDPTPSLTRANFAPIYGRHASACTRIFKGWSWGDVDHDGYLEECLDFMGITAHCAEQGGGVGQEYPPQDVHPKFFKCVFPVKDEDVLDQIEHIANGVVEGLVTAAPFVALAAQAYACADGVLFACGTLAADIAERSGVVPDDVKVPYRLVKLTYQCSDGDIVSCANLGAAGAKAVGVDIPGEDAGQVALLTQRCANDDFGACMRLGEMAAGAAGVSSGAISMAAINAQKCYDGDPAACIALGEQAADARVPVHNLPNGDDLIRKCSPGDVNNVDEARRSFEDCRALGTALAAIPR